jgi:hypothetical protein
MGPVFRLNHLYDYLQKDLLIINAKGTPYKGLFWNCLWTVNYSNDNVMFIVIHELKACCENPSDIIKKTYTITMYMYMMSFREYKETVVSQFSSIKYTSSS